MYTDRIDPDHPEGRLLVSDRGFELKDPASPVSPEPLESKADRLFLHIEKSRFEDKTVQNLRRTYAYIRTAGGPRSVDKYNTILKEHPSDRASLARWLLFDFYDMLPSGRRINKSSYSALSPYYRDMVDNGMRAGRKTGIRDLTISVEASMATNFFHHLQGIGVKSLSLLTEAHVRDYTRNGTCGPMTLYRISVFLRRYTDVYGDAEAAAVLYFFPKEKLVRKVYPAITPEERDKLERFLLSDGCPLSKRDLAAVMLMFYLGMRAGDVRDLRVGDVDWGNDLIRFRQGKTLGEMALPLRPVVGNALYDYIANERPRGCGDRLFMSVRPHAGEYRGCNINGMANKAYALAGIRGGSARKGTHLLRHSLADAMIGSGDDISMVAKTLGHLNPGTTLGYLSSNIEQLRSCALSIEPYPVNSKYYRHE